MNYDSTTTLFLNKMTFIIAVPQPLDGMVSLDILLRHFEKTDPVIYKTAVSYHKKTHDKD